MNSERGNKSLFIHPVAFSQQSLDPISVHRLLKISLRHRNPHFLIHQIKIFLGPFINIERNNSQISTRMPFAFSKKQINISFVLEFLGSGISFVQNTGLSFLVFFNQIVNHFRCGIQPKNSRHKTDGPIKRPFKIRAVRHF